MTEVMRYRKVVITLGFWEDEPGYFITEQGWREALDFAVETHPINPDTGVVVEDMEWEMPG